MPACSAASCGQRLFYVVTVIAGKQVRVVTTAQRIEASQGDAKHGDGDNGRAATDLDELWLPQVSVLVI